MNSKFYVYPYCKGSKSARALADALGAKVLKRENSKFSPKPNRVVINWGSSLCPWDGCLNENLSIGVVADKLKFFRLVSCAKNEPVLQDYIPRVPEWTKSKEEAQSWADEGFTIFARKHLTGHSGSGIVQIEPGEGVEVYDAPLYTKYIKKDQEYRVHVFNGEVIDVQRKVKDPNREVTNWQVRNHQNGFIFIRNTPEGISYREAVQDDVKAQALKGMKLSGLLFGACDVIFNKHKQEAYLLEINSSPGLEGESSNIYAEAFRKYVNG